MAERVSVRRRDEANSQALFLLGFAFFETWATVTLGSWRGIGDIAASWGAGAFGSPMAQSLALAALVVVFGLCYRRIEKVVFSPRCLGIVTIVAVGLSLCVSLLAEASDGFLHGGAPAAPLLATVVFALQALFKLLLLAWFRAIAFFDIELVLKNCLAVLFCAAFLGGVVELAPAPLRSICAILMAVAQLVCLLKIDHAAPLASSDGVPAPPSLLAKILCASAVLCVLFRLLGSANTLAADIPALATFCTVFYSELGAILMVLSGCVLVASVIDRHRSSQSFSVLPLVVSVALLLAWALAALLSEPAHTASARVLGQMSFDLVFVIFFLLLGYQLSCSGFHLFVFNEAVFTGVYVVVRLLVDVLAAQGGDTFSSAMLNVLIVSAQCIVAFFFVMGWIIARNSLSDSFSLVLRFFLKHDALSEQSSTGAQPGLSSESATEEPTAGSAPDEQAEECAQDSPRESVIRQLAGRYHLSERETSVMALLIKGRSMKRAAEELYLSVGTVSTYVKRIYAKMDIHSRQELIDRFDEAKERSWKHAGDPEEGAETGS